MINDVIADSLTRIRNAGMRRNDVTTLVYSKTVEAILSILKENEYIESFKVIEDGNKKSINVVLKYDEKGRFVISEIKRISKPGRRVYKSASELKSFKNGYGIIIVSTNKGVISNTEAYKANVGGETLCSIW
jgi:small subunit ribosomal protein S8